MIIQRHQKGRVREIKKLKQNITFIKKEVRGGVKKRKKGKYPYFVKNVKDIKVRERVESSWKTLSDVVFYSIVILSIPFFVNNLQTSSLYSYLYVFLLLIFLIVNIILLSIKRETDRIVLKK